ncbi:MAG: hypothetical protein WCJ07_07825 [Verrucomicrobiota bacterium]
MKNELSPQQCDGLLAALQARLEANAENYGFSRKCNAPAANRIWWVREKYCAEVYAQA